jgi:hypothetical protein
MLHLVLDVVELMVVAVDIVADMARFLSNEEHIIVISFEKALLTQKGLGCGDVRDQRLV